MATAALMLFGAGLAVTLPANAATSVTDGFEDNAHIRWTSAEVRGKSLVFLNNIVGRRSGNNAAWLIAGPTAGEAARIHRQIRLDNPGPPVECFGSLYMKKAGGQRTPQPPATVTVHLRPTLAQAPVHSKVFTVSDTSGYQLFSLSFFPYMSLLTIDISSLNDVMIDDLNLQCVKPIR
jgi:hypothetical protein